VLVSGMTLTRRSDQTNIHKMGLTAAAWTSFNVPFDDTHRTSRLSNRIHQPPCPGVDHIRVYAQRSGGRTTAPATVANQKWTIHP
jgi:hypothetical protein